MTQTYSGFRLLKTSQNKQTNKNHTHSGFRLLKQLLVCLLEPFTLVPMLPLARAP